MVKDLGRFLSEVRLELAKVTWPSYNELTGSVLIVLIVVFFFAVYFGAVDLVFYKLAERIF
ncbi:MAG: preprotein translocase subunit SecE [Candidatus Babeliales bacterium]